jgi:hypothetical protein
LRTLGLSLKKKEQSTKDLGHTVHVSEAEVSGYRRVGHDDLGMQVLNPQARGISPEAFLELVLKLEESMRVEVKPKSNLVGFSLDGMASVGSSQPPQPPRPNQKSNTPIGRIETRRLSS